MENSGHFYTDVVVNRGSILERGYDAEGKRFTNRVKYEPYLFIPSQDAQGPYKTVDGDPVKRVDYPSIKAMRDAVKRYEEADYPFYGMTKSIYPYIHDEYPKEVPFNPEFIKIGYIDIEVKSDDGFPHPTEASKPITAICIKAPIGGEPRVLQFAYGEFETDREDVLYIRCKDENDLIDKFLAAWEKLDLDVISGWNIEFFDIPYLINRIKNVCDGEEYRRLSPWGLVREGQLAPNDMQDRQQVYYLLGITVLDYLRLYKNFPIPEQSSYRLDHIAHVDLKERKVDYSEYSSLFQLYKNDHQKFIEYNIQDTELVERLEEHHGLIQQCFAIAYDARGVFADAITSVNLWDVIIHGKLMDKNEVVPNPKRKNKLHQIEGAFVKDPLIGLHKWVVSFDLNSLYPHLIMQYNVSPETYVGSIERMTVDDVIDGGYNAYQKMMREKNITISPFGSMYTKDRHGFLPELMEHVYNGRVVWKKHMLEAEQALETETDPEKIRKLNLEKSKAHNMQMAMKIQLNSAYGALSNEYFRWYDDILAETITVSGQTSIRWIAKALNMYLNKRLDTNGVDYVVAIDTDSVYLVLDEMVRQECSETDIDLIVQWLDTLCDEELEPFIAQGYGALAEYVNAYENKMVMKREVISDKGLWVAKKRYVLNVHNSEGVQYTEPKIKLKGIEAVRSSTPQVCRDKIMDALKIMMNGTNEELIEFIYDFKKEFMSLPFEDVATPMGTHDFEKYVGDAGNTIFPDDDIVYANGTPMHVRASFIFNNMIRRLGLEKSYEPIKAGDKIKFAYLTIPNPTHENAVACLEAMPPEFNVDRYIDRERQFEKSFLNPISRLTDVMEWEVEEPSTNALDAFMG